MSKIPVFRIDRDGNKIKGSFTPEQLAGINKVGNKIGWRPDDGKDVDIDVEKLNIKIEADTIIPAIHSGGGTIKPISEVVKESKNQTVIVEAIEVPEEIISPDAGKVVNEKHVKVTRGKSTTKSRRRK